MLLYGHLDKQPEMTGWAEHLGPWKPVIEGDRLYGRGGADDGYAIFGSLAAVMALQAQGIAHSRCVVMIEACEESGSYDLPYYVDHLAAHWQALADRLPRFGLRQLRPDVADHVACDRRQPHRQGARGRRAFRRCIGGGRVRFPHLRQVLSRLDDEATGMVKPAELHAEIPQQRIDQAKRTAEVLGDDVYSKFPFVSGMRPVTDDLAELVLNRSWRPALSITGIAGLPALDRPATCCVRLRR